MASIGVGKVGAELGQIWADLDLELKTKFVHLDMLYISYLSFQVIRALDQRIISVQLASVNALTAITKLQKSMVKTRSNECHLYTCPLPSCTLQLLSLDQIELLNKIWRTRDVNADVDEFLDLEYFCAEISSKFDLVTSI